MSDVKESEGVNLVKQRKEFKELYKNADESQVKSYYYMKVKQFEDLIKQDWFMKLNKEGVDITPEMGKPSFTSKKKFIEDVEAKLENRNKILA